MGYGGDKTTIMILKVDLQCCSCYKKVKKILCKFPQIRNQEYDEKNNRVTISVVCCDPEKLRDKLCSKGCGVINSIEIKEPEKPKKTPKPDAPPPAPEPKKTPKPDAPPPAPEPKKTPKPDAPPPAPEPQKTPKPDAPPPAPEPKKTPKPDAPPPAPGPVCIRPMPIQEYPQPPPGYCCGQCYEGHTGGPCYQPPRPAPEPVCIMPKPIQESPQPPPGYCCGQCYEGHTGGPCYQLYGRPVPPPPCYHYCVCYGPCGCCRGCYVSRCDQYVFSDENATGCSIM